MSEEILSLAFIEPVAGREAECESRLKEIGAVVERKQYGHDVLYRDSDDPHSLVLTRHWRNAQERRQAQEDPDLHHLWRELSEVCTVTKIYEQLAQV
jgi:hypothetical protein